MNENNTTQKTEITGTMAFIQSLWPALKKVMRNLTVPLLFLAQMISINVIAQENLKLPFFDDFEQTIGAEGVFDQTIQRFRLIQMEQEMFPFQFTI